MKKTALLTVGIVIVGIGCFLSYSAGYARGFAAGKTSASTPDFIPSISNEVPLPSDAIAGKPSNPDSSKPVQHHYEFKQNGVSIYRFDLDTGDACWIQLSLAEAKSPMPRCILPPQPRAAPE